MASTATPHTGYQVPGAQPMGAGGPKGGRDYAASNKAGEKAEGVLQSVKDAVSSVTESAQGAYEATTQTISGFNDDVMNIINRHPKQAVLIGFGVGFLVGALVCGGVFSSKRRS